MNTKTFPDKENNDRIKQYTINKLLLDGNHYEAFNYLGLEHFEKEYRSLRYVTANYLGLVSKVSADTLFSEKFAIEAQNENTNDFIYSLINSNNLYAKLHESAITNSSLGDVVFRLSARNSELIIEAIDPNIYYKSEEQTASGEPEYTYLVFKHALYDSAGNIKKAYLVQERHYPGLISYVAFTLKRSPGLTTEARQLDSFNVMGDMVDIAEVNNLIEGANYPTSDITTYCKYPLLFHVPNVKYSPYSQWGVSDYIDLRGLQFSLNNRITKIDNVLDNHSNPILALPSGILDENGRVRKENIELFEKGDDGEIPEYIVWNANLEYAFKQIDTMVEFLYMTSEITPDVLGMGKGQAESGRALKIKMIRTIAKRNRKRTYYEPEMLKMFTAAQQLSTSLNYTTKDGLLARGINDITISWQDGIVDDQVETAEIQVLRHQAGLQTKKAALQEMDKLTSEQAEEKASKILSEQADFTSFDGQDIT